MGYGGGGGGGDAVSSLLGPAAAGLTGLATAGITDAIFGKPKKADIYFGPNPYTGVLLNLFGIGAGTGRGGVMVAPGVFGFADPLFQPSDFNKLRDLLEPIGDYGLVENVEDLVAKTFGNVGSVTDFLRNTLQPAAEELARTGFRTDISPIREQALRQLKRETIPGIAEQYAGITGGFSSDFLNSITQAAGDVETQLGSLQTGLDEAAAQRRLQGLPLSALLSSSQVALPLAFGSDFLNILAQVQNAERQQQPGFNFLQGLGAILNLAPQQSIIQSQPTMSSLESTLRTLASTFAGSAGTGLGQSAGSLFDTRAPISQGGGGGASSVQGLDFNAGTVNLGSGLSAGY